MLEGEISVLDTGQVKARLPFTAEAWKEVELQFAEEFPQGVVQVEPDGSVLCDLSLSTEEWAALSERLPDESEEGDATPMGLLPKAHWYCVKVWTRQGGRRFVCQKSIYESPLWAWARAAGIGLRKAGTKADVNMSSGRCSGEQNSCHC